MRRNYNPKIRKRILEVLSKGSIAHISDVAKKAETTRITATKHLERLEKEGIVEEHRRGMLRLFALRSGNARGEGQ